MLNYVHLFIYFTAEEYDALTQVALSPKNDGVVAVVLVVIIAFTFSRLLSMRHQEHADICSRAILFFPLVFPT